MGGELVELRGNRVISLEEVVVVEAAIASEQGSPAGGRLWAAAVACSCVKVCVF